jgi:hypothetical protein
VGGVASFPDFAGHIPIEVGDQVGLIKKDSPFSRSLATAPNEAIFDQIIDAVWVQTQVGCRIRDGILDWCWMAKLHGHDAAVDL